MAHRSKVLEAENRLTARGFSFESGGNAAKRKIDGRLPDLVMTKGDTRIAVQVGRRTLGGKPVSRERKAIVDLKAATDHNGPPYFDHVFFVRY